MSTKSQTAITPLDEIEEAPLPFKLGLRKGAKREREVEVVAIQWGPNKQKVREIKFKAIFPVMSLDEYNQKFSGYGQTEILRIATVAAWDVPIEDDQGNFVDTTTRDHWDKYPRAIMDGLLNEPFIMTAMWAHMLTVRDEGSVDNLHRELRKGN